LPFKKPSTQKGLFLFPCLGIQPIFKIIFFPEKREIISKISSHKKAFFLAYAPFFKKQEF
jgi:hypothetical protein